MAIFTRTTLTWNMELLEPRRSERTSIKVLILLHVAVPETVNAFDIFRLPKDRRKARRPAVLPEVSRVVRVESQRDLLTLCISQDLSGGKPVVTTVFERV